VYAGDRTNTTSLVDLEQLCQKEIRKVGADWDGLIRGILVFAKKKGSTKKGNCKDGKRRGGVLK